MKKRNNIIIITVILSIILIITIFWVINIIIGEKGTGDKVNDHDATGSYLKEYYISQRYEEYYEEVDWTSYNPENWNVDIYELNDIRVGHIDISYSADRIEEPHWFIWNDEDTDDPDWYSYSEYRTIYFLKDSHGNNISQGSLMNEWFFSFRIDLFSPQYSLEIDEADDYRFIVFTKAPDYQLTLTYRSDLYYPSIIYTCCLLPIMIILASIFCMIVLIVRSVKKKRSETCEVDRSTSEREKVCK